jgi:UDP-3-O-[3-hydroxymyristoyl] glucosamine N-acyltransferase
VNDLVFFPPPLPRPLTVVAAQTGSTFTATSTRLFTSVASLELAGPADVSVMADGDTLEALETTLAGACFVVAKHERHVPSATIALLTSDPAGSFRRAAELFYPDCARPSPTIGKAGVDATAIVHREARLEGQVTIEPGAVIGPRVEIGAGTTIGAHTTIGAGVRIGRGCAIDSHVSIAHALIGDHVVVYAGARIGLGGPGRDPKRGGGLPHLGRVIIQNAAAIGANAIIERGRLGDTVIGDGSRIEALAVVEADAIVDRLVYVAR